jgi:signal transduction histidine kinase
VTIIEEVLDFLEPKIRFKNIKVITDFYSNDIFVHADQRMMETAVRNLISNAVKFNYENGKLFIRAFKQDGHTIFEVEDTGVGMDRETRDQLFKNEDVSDRQNAGLDESAGLGLKLSKEFLDKHGAMIDIESEPGKGSKFIVKL